MGRPVYVGHSKVNSLLDEGLKSVADIRINTQLSGDGRPIHPELSSYQSPPPPSSIPWSPEGDRPSLPNDYLSSPGGFGNGHLFTASEAPNVHNTPLTMSVEPSYPSPPRATVDDFGVNLNRNNYGDSPLSSGNHFSTMPSNPASRGTHLYGGPSPTLNVGPPSHDQAGDSFASSMEDALRAASQKADEPAPAYAAMTLPQASPHTPNFQTRPPGAGPPHSTLGINSNPWEDPRRSMAISEGDAQLAYADEREPSPSNTRHPRFGDVTDINEEMDKRYHLEDKETESATTTLQASSRSPEEEQREQNIAAAREISNELDARSYDSSPRIEIPPASLSEEPQLYAQPPLERNFSPLAPPSAPFANRAVSPNYTDTVPREPDVSPPSMTTAQHYAHAHRLSETMAPEELPLPASPRTHADSPPALHIPIDDAPPPQLRSPAQSFSTPPEYPAPRGRGPFQSQSATSVASSGGPGKISAAAFRRGTGSGPGGPRLPAFDATAPAGGIEGPTPPLAFKKRVSGAPFSERGPPGQQIPNSISPLPSDEDGHYDYIGAYGNDRPN
jgi:hypothetical protein